MRDIVIFSIGAANELLKQGFRMVKVMPHKNLSGELVFYFENTEAARQYLANNHNIIIK